MKKNPCSSNPEVKRGGSEGNCCKTENSGSVGEETNHVAGANGAGFGCNSAEMRGLARTEESPGFEGLVKVGADQMAAALEDMLVTSC